MAWKRPIRFVALKDGNVYCGEPNLIDEQWPRDVVGLKAVTSREVTVQKLLAPLAKVPIFRAIGLNYKEHAQEFNSPIPNYPIVFLKPPNVLQHPNEPIVVPYVASNQEADYEVELAVVIGKAFQLALGYVLGYTICSDVSSRRWQSPAYGSGQWCFSKGFDTYAPMGPCIVNRSLTPNPQALTLTTRLNGQTMQNSSTADMIFPVAELISFLSQGTTLQPGEVLTGTPQGLAVLEILLFG
ncbi:hypothetical protein K493DRAFT_388100 [Basidiobolus meristosporus CBS 931.73]|uniref:Fumarylacetoacetase-like C-terminal domain-containing protein n=1 Tax=Basidiobolus meristosporus CBS 931.73 TaxID=1314790 RepID=A0A1Y1XCF9_9FUNG|nr:hypothetical protein K493DRAFT_388100 [Basidiobolus meristosporus CBS 931.73]|eukprot:ORX83397.1 hypothetical protein K493DRAFT_388100 [Basidiobolus meristosporus CBS 931.73]